MAGRRLGVVGWVLFALGGGWCRVVRVSGNEALHKARRAGQDEFYTEMDDIEDELKYYKPHFAGKTVYCNCDDPYESNFFQYFALQFNNLSLKRLITTSYAGSPIVGEQLSLDDVIPHTHTSSAYKADISEITDLSRSGSVGLEDAEMLLRARSGAVSLLEGDGDFRSQECQDLLAQADIVVTNPPFSLFREYVAQLIEHNKKFLILGQQNAITYKEIFPLIKNGKLWLGYNNGGTKWFRVPENYDIKTESRKRYEKGVKQFSMGSVNWFTNLDHSKRDKKLKLIKTYTPEEYPRYDNYDAINVDKVAFIPEDYDGVMGVPITFLDKHNPKQFEILIPQTSRHHHRLMRCYKPQQRCLQASAVSRLHR